MRISDWSSDVCSSDLRKPSGCLDLARHEREEGRTAIMLYSTPAAVSAASTATRDASDAGMIGRRTSGWNQSWMRDSAYLSGAGEASENIALCRDRKSTRLNSSH